jgi:hypothetical protein
MLRADLDELWRLSQGELTTVDLGGALAGTYTFAMLVNTSDCDEHNHQSDWVVGS